MAKWQSHHCLGHDSRRIPSDARPHNQLGFNHLILFGLFLQCVSHDNIALAFSLLELISKTIS
ncbi:hypothetical protein GTG28_08680 [Vibrio sp. OCN044]|uniref:Uncharacterized protein n=1 Tax=Vibrio tetraodonis subsp. pristinus TaxID=2695891 RepID=A0A6L8LTA8_9VIBR|nr:hypothetical protein [Vibrio tetraodonis]MYM59298.1 hypothetical protein [Vibrio tetraodonis subsp. pristinus]